ncbi:XRE family transcriptional regulator [Stenotrophomonas maltophilia]|uniref:helix-turn-helix domain-containing protein n=1 Tax=Stenotrophomonas maltophilia TaxID=40324 RepID=UPI0015DF80AA|nr:helix-turn-helix transcriptional regulator [Stenotrophomonas maltophilia]MBA0234584.1 XRE family transcriptional regulator [Stenotrophomonas maltophilia]MBA0269058.1 XRE family transcriptional regulator [Stenotrophomonas maltophilia]
MREVRSRLRISQESFADSIGMHRAYYSALERGTKNPTVSPLNRVARGLCISLAQLFSTAELLEKKQH